MSGSIYKKIGIASLIMMASIFLSRLTGLAREMVIAYIGGAGADVDAYQIAFVIPEILNHVVASGFLSVTFIPIFTAYLVRDKEDDGWAVFSTVLNSVGIILGVMILAAFMLAPRLIQVLAPGVQNPELAARAVRMTRIILPAQLLFFAGGMLMAVQFARERFFFPALAPLVYNLGIISGGLILGPWLGMEAFSWGVLCGAFVGNFLLQYWGARKAGMKWRMRVNLKHPDLKKYICLTLPLIIGLTMTFSTEIFLKYFGSFLPEGGISALNYAFRMMLMLVGLFGQAVGVASFPFLARLAAEKNFEQMNRLLDHSLRYLSLVIPLSVLLMVLRHEVVMIIFQRGRFDAAATELTARALLFLLVGSFGFAAQTIVVRGYYAIQNTLLPAIFGTLAVVMSLPLYWYGLRIAGISGVALAVTLSAVLQVLVLYGVWNKKSHNRGSRSVYALYGRMLLISAGIGFMLEAFKTILYRHVSDGSTITGSLIVIAVVTAAFFVMLAVAGYLFRVAEVEAMALKLVNRMTGRRTEVRGQKNK
ncbi:MAG: murein biosynthesis integral membrane protein MurJ [Desulfobacterales bacterium]|nr:murein biosynthesis integral membrane protein MurJ [Desulfobacterales bacterium]MDD4071060.1 murein biosynthesis integral membrane protein MurJ [Desulfobacterales bacterium]MDD4392457.1 murein biosynthesis integral membrane protein MurJ [Desulfobacterales bacterium]